MKKIFALPGIARSAKASLFPLLLSLATLAFSQQKPEFGFLVKVGNYALPNNSSNDKYSYNFSEKNSAGSTYTLGIWQSIPLGNRFRLSAELLYRNAFYSTEQHTSYSNSPGIFAMPVSSRQVQKINHSSLSLPVKLHFLFKKAGKTSIALGAGFSRKFAMNIRNRYEYEEGPIQFLPSDYQEKVAAWDAFSTDFHIAAGLFHRFDPKTSIGFEYTFEPTGHSYEGYNLSLSRYCECLCDCGYGYGVQNMPNMNSFSVSLRHNILD